MFDLSLVHDLSRLKTALSVGLDVNAHDDNGWTYLHHAAWENDAGAAQLLLRFGANPDSMTKIGNSPLQCVDFDSGGIEVVQVLVAAGCDVNSRGSGGETALHHAAMAERPSVVEYLLSHGADPNILSDTGETVLDYSYNHQVNNLLRKFGAVAMKETEKNDGKQFERPD